MLAEIADLLELKGDNPFKIRAYRNAADIVSTPPKPSSAWTRRPCAAGTGIGKDLAGRIREIATDRRLRHPPGSADRVPADAARRDAPAGRRTEDRRDALQGTARSRASTISRRRPRPAAFAALKGMGAQEGAADSPGARGTAAARRTPSAVARHRSGRRARRLSEGARAAGRDRRRSAASGAARRPAAISTSSPAAPSRR